MSSYKQKLETLNSEIFFFFFNVLLFGSHPACYPSLCRDSLTSEITFKFIDLCDPRK